MQSSWLNESYSSEHLLESGSNEIWIKRDDLIHPIVSGNKWRKLKYVIRDCLEKGINHIVTYGGAYSNHALATACACAQMSLKCTILMRGEQPPSANHYTLLIKSFGAELIYISRQDYKSKKEALRFVKYQKERTCILPEGGAHELAYKGCGEIISGLRNRYDALFLASGTGTTSLGILQYLKGTKSNMQVYIVPVLKNVAEITEMTANFFNSHVIEKGHLGGYAKTTPALFKVIDKTLKNHAILLDPVYTAKSYLAMENEIISWKGKRVLFLHTGGQMGLFSEPMLKSWRTHREAQSSSP